MGGESKERGIAASKRRTCSHERCAANATPAQPRHTPTPSLRPSPSVPLPPHPTHLSRPLTLFLPLPPLSATRLFPSSQRHTPAAPHIRDHAARRIPQPRLLRRRPLAAVASKPSRATRPTPPNMPRLVTANHAVHTHTHARTHTHTHASRSSNTAKHAQLHTHTLCARQRPATNVPPPLLPRAPARPADCAGGAPRCWREGQRGGAAPRARRGDQGGGGDGSGGCR